LAVRWYHWAACLFALDLVVLYVWFAVGIPEDCGWKDTSAPAWRCGVLLDFLHYYWVVFLAVSAALAVVVVGGLLRSSRKKARKS
jgi:hypothetical protein